MIIIILEKYQMVLVNLIIITIRYFSSKFNGAQDNE